MNPSIADALSFPRNSSSKGDVKFNLFWLPALCVEVQCPQSGVASGSPTPRASFEGVFRQASVVKGHNRDTAWYAAVDHEWPALNKAFETWLAAENFDGGGRQRRSLSSLTKALLTAKG